MLLAAGHRRASFLEVYMACIPTTRGKETKCCHWSRSKPCPHSSPRSDLKCFGGEALPSYTTYNIPSTESANLEFSSDPSLAANQVQFAFECQTHGEDDVYRDLMLAIEAVGRAFSSGLGIYLRVPPRVSTSLSSLIFFPYRPIYIRYNL
ncbi:hypothetical protein F5Y03DRAFT_345654 [Xylaria venustula]|nr:hypothetical protein F5Y03DRAFT_345654 [Xylaria venustula]